MERYSPKYPRRKHNVHSRAKAHPPCRVILGQIDKRDSQDTSLSSLTYMHMTDKYHHQPLMIHTKHRHARSHQVCSFSQHLETGVIPIAETPFSSRFLEVICSKSSPHQNHSMFKHLLHTLCTVAVHFPPINHTMILAIGPSELLV